MSVYQRQLLKCEIIADSTNTNYRIFSNILHILVCMGRYTIEWKHARLTHNAHTSIFILTGICHLLSLSFSLSLLCNECCSSWCCVVDVIA